MNYPDVSAHMHILDAINQKILTIVVELKQVSLAKGTSGAR